MLYLILMGSNGLLNLFLLGPLPDSGTYIASFASSNTMFPDKMTGAKHLNQSSGSTDMSGIVSLPFAMLGIIIGDKAP